MKQKPLKGAIVRTRVFEDFAEAQLQQAIAKRAYPPSHYSVRRFERDVRFDGISRTVWCVIVRHRIVPPNPGGPV